MSRPTTPLAVQARLADYLQDEVLPTLQNAADALEHWGGYVDDYFKHKHCFDADVAQVRSVIARVEKVLSGQDALGEYD